MTPRQVFLFVIWSKGMGEAEMLTREIAARFKILKQFDVTWRKRDFVKNFAAFYGWKSWGMWVGKKRRSGSGPFRAIFILDEHPVFEDREKLGIPEAFENMNVYNFKVSCRELTKHSNVVHASVNEPETRQNLRAITGETLEEFLARGDLDGSLEVIRVERPLEYVPYPYAEENGKGPRFFAGKLRLNRIEIYLLPRCGLSTVFSFSIRFGGLFSLAFCIGKVKVG